MRYVAYAIALLISGTISSAVLYMAGAFDPNQGRDAKLIFGAVFAVALVVFIFAHLNKRYLVAMLALAATPFVVGFGLLALDVIADMTRKYGPNPAFAAFCKDVGSQYDRVPASPVNSIALTWIPPREIRDTRISTDGSGHLRGIEGTIMIGPWITDAANADVVVTQQITGTDGIDAPPSSTGARQYTLTVTDRRDGSKLGSMRYAVDRKRWRACGENVDKAIDLEVFIRLVTGLPEHGGKPYDEPEPVELSAVVTGRTDTPSGELIAGPEWEALSYAPARRDRCDAIVPQISEGSQQRRFAADTSGTKRVIGAPWDLICDEDAVFVTQYGRKDIAITKYRLNGERVYGLRFMKPEEIPNDPVALLVSTLKSQDGVLTLVLANQHQTRGDRIVVRRMSMRIVEPH